MARALGAERSLGTEAKADERGRLIGPDGVLFRSDYPHPEGLAEPTSYVDQLAELPHDDIARIMGGNLLRLYREVIG